MRRAVMQGDAPLARGLAAALVESGADLVAAVESGFVAGIREVGRLWQAGEYFLPELVQGAEAMKAAMAVVRPALVAQGAGAEEPRARVVIGTVRGDLHDIGKTLVAALLEAHGFEVHDLGTDVPVEAFLARARQVGARIVAASALLTTTMPAQRELARALAATGPEGPRALVGGAPTSEAWAREIGAAWAESAPDAVRVAEELVA